MDCSGVGDCWSPQRFLGRTKFAHGSPPSETGCPTQHLMLPLNWPPFQPLCIFITVFLASAAFEEGCVTQAAALGSSNEVGRWCCRYQSSRGSHPNPPFILTTLCSKCAKLTMERYASGGAVRETRDDFIAEGEGSLEFTLLLPSWLLTPAENNLDQLLSESYP